MRIRNDWHWSEPTLKRLSLAAQLLSIFIAFIAGLSIYLWGLVFIALLLGYFGYWAGERRVQLSDERIQPRVLSEDERRSWASEMSRFKGVRAKVYGLASDQESRAFGGAIIRVLTDAGLNVEPSLMASAGDVMPDIAIFIDKRHENDSIGAAGLCFVNLVAQKRFVFFARSVPDPELAHPQQVEPGALHIHIGPRYFGLLG